MVSSEERAVCAKRPRIGVLNCRSGAAGDVDRLSLYPLRSCLRRSRPARRPQGSLSELPDGRRSSVRFGSNCLACRPTRADAARGRQLDDAGSGSAATRTASARRSTEGTVGAAYLPASNRTANDVDRRWWGRPAMRRFSLNPDRVEHGQRRFKHDFSRPCACRRRFHSGAIGPTHFHSAGPLQQAPANAVSRLVSTSVQSSGGSISASCPTDDFRQTDANAHWRQRPSIIERIR